jgi:DNA/RNA endonuclease YhcR with UshA esterase domain
MAAIARGGGTALGQKQATQVSAMRALFSAAVIGLAALALAAPASAHHGWGSYDSSKTVTIEATIVDVKYENPHVEIVLEAQGKKWTMTLAPVFRMQNRGVPQPTLVKGKKVKVEGYVSKVHGDEMRIERISVDGKTVELR